MEKRHTKSSKNIIVGQIQMEILKVMKKPCILDVKNVVIEMWIL